MKIELQLTEIEEYIKSSYDTEILITYVELNKLEIDYMIKMRITIKEVRDYSVVFGYELSWVTNLIALGAKYMSKNNFDKKILQWNSSRKEITLDLTHINALSNFLKLYKIKQFSIKDSILYIEFSK